MRRKGGGIISHVCSGVIILPSRYAMPCPRQPRPPPPPHLRAPGPPRCARQAATYQAARRATCCASRAGVCRLLGNRSLTEEAGLVCPLGPPASGLGVGSNQASAALSSASVCAAAVAQTAAAAAVCRAADRAVVCPRPFARVCTSSAAAARHASVVLALCLGACRRRERCRRLCAPQRWSGVYSPLAC